MSPEFLVLVLWWREQFFSGPSSRMASESNKQIMADDSDGGGEEADRSAITALKRKRAVVKRRITNTLKKLQLTMEQLGRKAIIRGYVNILEESLKEAQDLNDRLMATLPENEHESALNWYEEELERVQDAKLEAEAHLEQRADESSSELSSVKLSKLSTSSHLQAAEIRAKMASAEMKAKQLAMEEQRRKQEFEKQLELKQTIEQAQIEAERVQFEAQERRKTQEAKDEAARLAAEVEGLEKVRNYVHFNDPESLSNRLRDFEDDPLEEIPPSTADKPLNSQPLPGFTENVQTSCGTVLPTINTSCTVKSSPLLQQPKSSVSFTVPQSSSKLEKAPPIYQSWIGDLPKGAQPDVTPRADRKHVIHGYSARDSLPKLQLNKFDGDPLHWSDWSSMFKSVVHDAALSLNGKMQHLQNSVVGRAKSAIEGYGYSGDSYYEALKELEARFGKPSLVVKVTLDRLRRTPRLHNDRPHEVRSLSDVVSTTVWTFKRFGYESDLAAEANISLAVDKLSPELQVKWKDHVRAINLQRPSLEDFCNWLKGQADIYDDCYVKTSNFKFPFHPFKNKGRQGGTNERQSTFFGNFSHRNKQTKSCLMGDGQLHNLSACPKFKALSVEERLKEVQKYKLCFCCLRSDHWVTSCRNLKQCGVNGCTRPHNALLHALKDEPPEVNDVTAAATGQTLQGAVTSSTEHSSTSHKSSSDSVLLQVVPVTLHGPKGYFDTYAMLDTGSTCSLLSADVAETLGLDGPVESVLLNGIQKTSKLLAKRVDVRISPLNDFGTQFDVNRVLVVDRLNVPERRVKLRELQEKWPHLTDLELTEVSGTQVTLLLGSDVPELIVPLETRCGPMGSPVGIRTKIG